MSILTKEQIGEKVNEALEQLRPFLEADGGNMELVGITDDMVVQVKLLGACSTCSMSAMTMKAGLEEAVKKAVPQIKAVVAVNSLDVDYA
ncbi:MAG: NifU family protein [Flavobacteriales bacterium]